MDRRQFVAGAMGAAVVSAKGFAAGFSGGGVDTALKPMAVGLMIQPANGPEEVIARVKNLGMSNCFLSLDAYIGKFTPRSEERRVGKECA